MEARLRASPNDPEALTYRAKWRRAHLNFQDAIADLDRLLTSKPTSLWTARARKLFLRYAVEYADHDFAAAVKHFDPESRLWRTHRSWVSEGADKPNQPEYRQVLALSLFGLVARAEGQPLAVLDALLSLVGVHAPGVVVPVKGDPPRRLSYAVWARGRLAAQERKAVDAGLAAKWRLARAKNDAPMMHGLMALVGVEHPLGREIQFHLASRLAEGNRQREAERLLLEVRRGPDPVDAAKAVVALAEMMTQARQMRDALAYYRILGRDHAKLRVAPGKTGADVLADLAADKRFLPFLTTPSPMLPGRYDLRYGEKRVQIPEVEGFTFIPVGETLPFFRRLRLTLVDDELRIRNANGAHFKVRLDPTNFTWIGADSAHTHLLRYDYQSLGHVAILNLGARVVGIDAVVGKVLWQYDILGLGNAVPRVWSTAYDLDGSARIEFVRGGQVRLGDPMPLTPTRLCLTTKAGLVALDPLTGEVCWSRRDVPLDCRLFSDGTHVFVIRRSMVAEERKVPVQTPEVPVPETSTEAPASQPRRPALVVPAKPWPRKLGGPFDYTAIGLPLLETPETVKRPLPKKKQPAPPRRPVTKVKTQPVKPAPRWITMVAAYRLEDVAAVAVKDFSALYENRLRILDGRLLVQEKGARKALILRLYDVASGKDVWRQTFPPGTQAIHSEGEELTGVVEPTGKVLVFEARTKKPVMSSKLVDPQHVEGAKAIRLVGDRDFLYLAVEGPPDERRASEPMSLFSARAGLRAIPVNGAVYAFRRSTGKIVWYYPWIYNQTLLVTEIERLPMVWFASGYMEWIGQRPARARVYKPIARAIAKHNGKVWYDNENLPLRMHFQTLRVDEKTGTVEVIGRELQVTMFAVPK
jgi:hypothetical protein